MQWKKGQPNPAANHSTISHPGLKQSVPQLLKSTTQPTTKRTVPGISAEAADAASTSTTTAAQGTSANAAGTVEVAPSPVTPPGQLAEPNADMPVPQGSERNMNGDKVQRWCQERQAAAPTAVGNQYTSAQRVDTEQDAGLKQEWFNVSLPSMTVLVSWGCGK
jgi:hypothetical protein